MTTHEEARLRFEEAIRKAVSLGWRIRPFVTVNNRGSCCPVGAAIVASTGEVPGSCVGDYYPPFARGALALGVSRAEAQAFATGFDGVVAPAGFDPLWYLFGTELRERADATDGTFGYPVLP